MGQQQLLLIVLGVIIVGIAVVVGINVFTASSAQANQDAVVADLTNIAAMAQQYFRKPAALGGGGNSFANFAIPAQLQTTANGAYTIATAGDATKIVFKGEGVEEITAGTKVQAWITVTSTTVTTSFTAPGG